MPPPRPDDVLQYYKRSLDALTALKEWLNSALDAGQSLPASSNFLSMTAAEIGLAFDDLHVELKREVVLMLVASFEAVLQLDLQNRVSRKLKDGVSSRLRKWWYKTRRKYANWVELEALLEAWKKASTCRPRVIGRMKSLVLHRHWLAHGRYWTDKSGLGAVDPFVAWQIGKQLFDNLPGFPTLSHSPG